MVSIVSDKLDQLTVLCRRFGVQRLEVFGSAASGDDFDQERSDLDFLVEFLPEQDLGPWLSHFFAFRDELSQLYERPVDLVLSSAPRNRYFAREVNRTRQTLYAA